MVVFGLILVLFGLVVVIFGLVMVIVGESWTRRGGLWPAVGARVVNRAQEWLVPRDASRVRDGPFRRWDDDQRASGHAAGSEVSQVKGDGAPRLADGPRSSRGRATLPLLLIPKSSQTQEHMSLSIARLSGSGQSASPGIRLLMLAGSRLSPCGEAVPPRVSASLSRPCR